MKESLDNLVNEVTLKNKLISTKHGLLIKEYYVSTLSKYGININELTTYDDALFLINNFVNNCDDLTDDEYEELDQIATELQETKYYQNTNK